MSGKRWRRYTKKVGCLINSVARDFTEIERRQSKINWSFQLQHQDSRGPSKGGEDRHRWQIRCDHQCFIMLLLPHWLSLLWYRVLPLDKVLLHLSFPQNDLLEYSKKKNIILTACSPRGEKFSHFPMTPFYRMLPKRKGWLSHRSGLLLCKFFVGDRLMEVIT